MRTERLLWDRFSAAHCTYHYASRKQFYELSIYGILTPSGVRPYAKLWRKGVHRRLGVSEWTGRCFV